MRIRCGFCIRLVELQGRRDEMTEQDYEQEIEALFDLADRTHQLHTAYGQRRRRR